jgi:diacylglycerol kinase (CTP)
MFLSVSRNLTPTHSALGFVCLYLYRLGYEPKDITPLLVYIFIPAFFGDVVRFVWPSFNRLWTKVMGPLMRDREKQQWNGVIFYLLGAWIVLSFFPKVPHPTASN